MKYIKTQENFFKNIFKKKNILPEELMNFFNSMIIFFNELFNHKLFYKQNKVHHYYDGGYEYLVYEIKFYVDSMSVETHLFSIQYHDSFKQNNYLKFDFEPEWITTKYEVFVDFLMHLIAKYSSFTVLLNELYNVTSKLNKDEYELFLLKKNTDKYNL